jgi:CheY-like chemotaxis protein
MPCKSLICKAFLILRVSFLKHVIRSENTQGSNWMGMGVKYGVMFARLCLRGTRFRPETIEHFVFVEFTGLNWTIALNNNSKYISTMDKPVRHFVLADDDEDDVAIFHLALSEVCPDIVLNVAKNGAALLKMLNEIGVPDLIILDINMPFVTGRDCLKKIRANAIYDFVPVVMLTTSHDFQEIDFCLANGAFKFFTKPSSIIELKKIIEEICHLSL